jgi:tRNA modification GTPase
VLVEQADIVLWLGSRAGAPDRPGLIQVHAKSDLGGAVAEDFISVSSVSGDGIRSLLDAVSDLARTLLPAADTIALNRRQATELESAMHALQRASGADDAVLVAEELRQARAAFDRLTGRAGVEDVLDALFSRFCLGK